MNLAVVQDQQDQRLELSINTPDGTIETDFELTADSVVKVFAGEGDDTVYDSLWWGNQNVEIHGGGGSDYIKAGMGRSVDLDGDAGDDRILSVLVGQ